MQGFINAPCSEVMGDGIKGLVSSLINDANAFRRDFKKGVHIRTCRLRNGNDSFRAMCMPVYASLERLHNFGTEPVLVAQKPQIMYGNDAACFFEWGKDVIDGVKYIQAAHHAVGKGPAGPVPHFIHKARGHRYPPIWKGNMRLVKGPYTGGKTHKPVRTSHRRQFLNQVTGIHADPGRRTRYRSNVYSNDHASIFAVD